MKTYLALVLGLACFSTATSLRADEGKVWAAVIAQACSAELRAADSSLAQGRKSFEVGEVLEMSGTSGRYGVLKIDATHVAMVPTSSLRMRECTAAELTQAKEKFNGLSHENQQKARKDVSNAKKSAMAQAAAGSCSSCPLARASAQNNAAAAYKAATEQNRALRKKQESLAKEALDWAAGQTGSATAAK